MFNSFEKHLTVEFKFDLDNPDERVKMMRMLAADGMAFALFELTHNEKRNLENIVESKNLDSFQTLDLVFERLNQLLEENEVSNEIIN